MLVVKLAGTQANSVSPNLVRRTFPLASYADFLRGSCGAGTRDEPLRTSAWEATRVPAPRTRDESNQPRSQGSLLPVPTERVGERTWEQGW